MSTDDPLRDAKRRISSALLDAPGISGVGLRGGKVVVYLERDDPAVRDHATTAAKKLAPGVDVMFDVSGPFKKQ